MVLPLPIIRAHPCHPWSMPCFIPVAVHFAAASNGAEFRVQSACGQSASARFKHGVKLRAMFSAGVMETRVTASCALRMSVSTSARGWMNAEVRGNGLRITKSPRCSSAAWPCRCCILWRRPERSQQARLRRIPRRVLRHPMFSSRPLRPEETRSNSEMMRSWKLTQSDHGTDCGGRLRLVSQTTDKHP